MVRMQLCAFLYKTIYPQGGVCVHKILNAKSLKKSQLSAYKMLNIIDLEHHIVFVVSSAT